ncbi:MAG: rod shape-determining protein MreC [Tepidisphaeraceae bacterium]
MSRVQFNQVFFGLMILSLLAAFVLPQRATDLGRTSFQTLLIPISRPTYRIANAIRGHFQPQSTEDTRSARTIEQENLGLKQQIQRMSAEIEQLEQRAGERASLGGFETYCTRFEVTAADSDNRDGLAIAGSGIGAVRVDQPVLSSGVVIDLIGRITAVGALAARVRLITDAGFTVTGHFKSYSAAGGFQENKDLGAIVIGRGGGQMLIDNLWIKNVRDAHVQVGDWVVLSDETWPRALQGVRIGRVASIQPLPKQSLFADIRLAPEENLMHLNDVWVMTHQP